LRVGLIGSGTSDDPYRVGLPTYTAVGDPDVVSGTMVVEVPDPDAPTKSRSGQLLTLLTQAEHNTWHALLDARYPEHAGAFRPQVK
jgi:hypothetical protein